MIIAAAISCSYALPQDPQVAEGEAVITYPDEHTMNISAANNTIINYGSFSIMENETVIMQLPSVDSAILNRVLGTEYSQLLGTLQSNGLVILVNENGIYVGPNANLQAAGLALSTRDITNENFLNANYVFKRLSKEELDMLLVNHGNITISNKGFAALIAGAIENNGNIIAQAGHIALAAGDAVKLELSANRLISVAILEKQANDVVDFQGNKVLDQIKNTGRLEAATVILKAESLPGIFNRTINMEGIVKGEQVVVEGEVVRIVSGKDAEILSVKAKSFDIKTESPVVDVVKPADLYITVSRKESDYITIETRDSDRISYLGTANVSITAPAIDQDPAVLIQAASLKLISDRFGTHASPLRLQAQDIHIKSLSMPLEILQSQGLGSTIMITGPPEQGLLFFEYNRDANLTLEASKVSLVGSDPISLYGNIQFVNFECTVPDKEIYFEAGKTYTFKGTTRIEGVPDGAEEYLIKLRSQTPGEQYSLKVEDSYKIDYVNISDANAVNHLYIPVGVDLGNNTNLEVDPVWDGGGIGNNWSTPQNWVGDLIPAPGADVTFNAAGNKDCTIDISVIVNNFTISGYTGIITQQGSVTISGSYAQSSGTFRCISQTTNTFAVLWPGSFTITGGVFNRYTGSGTSISPYIIRNVYDLQAMKCIRSAYYKLGGDIDSMLTPNWNSGAGFEPIGTQASPFTGTLDGDGYIISDININRPFTNYVGLLGYIGPTGVVTNVNLASGVIRGSIRTGALAGWSQGTITECFANTLVFGTSDVTGGLIGYNWGIITKSHVFGASVTGTNYVGGFVGANSGIVLQCYATSQNVTGTGNFVGGFVGSTDDSGGGGALISECFVTNTSARGARYVGGFAGRIGLTVPASSSAISYSYSTGTAVATSGLDRGGFLGIVVNSPVLSANFWDTQTSGLLTSAGQGAGHVEGKTTYEMKLTSTYTNAGWDFFPGGTSNVWAIAETSLYPYFTWEYDTVAGYVYSDDGITPVGSGITIRISYPGIAAYIATTNSYGAYYMVQFAEGSSPVHEGDRVLIIINNNTMNANTVTIGAEQGAVGISLYADTLLVRYETGISITNADLAAAYVAGPGDVIYTVTGSDLDLSGSLYIPSGYIYVPGGNISLTGSWTNSGTFNPGNNTVYFNGTAAGNTILSGGDRFWNMAFIGSGGAWSLSDYLAVNNDLSLANNATLIQNSNNIAVYGNWDNASGHFISDATVFFSATDADNFIRSNDDPFYNTEFNGSGGKWSLSDPFFVMNNFNLRAGEFDANMMNMYIGGNFTVISPALFTHSNNTVTFNASDTDNIISAPSQRFFNLVFTNGGKWTLAGAAYLVSYYIDNDISIQSGEVELSPAGFPVYLYVEGDWLNNGKFTSNTNTVYFTGDSLIRTGGSSSAFYAVGIGGLPGTAAIRLADDFYVNSGLFAMPATTRSMDFNGYTMHYGGTILNIVNINSFDMSDLGSTIAFNNNCLFTSTGKTLNNITTNAHLDMNSAMYLTGTIYIAPTATLDSSGYDITLLDSWINRGDFIHHNNTVTFDGADETVRGSTTFFNFNRPHASTLTFEAGSTQTVEGTLTLTGSAGDLLGLRSTSDGSQWYIDPQGPINVSYVDVKDSYNLKGDLTGEYIDPPNSNDSGNNNWWFSGGEPPIILKPGEEQQYPEYVFEADFVKKYKKHYARGKYRTTVILFEGALVVTPYKELSDGERSMGEVYMTSEQVEGSGKVVQEGEVF